MKTAELTTQRGPGWDVLNEIYATKKAPDLEGRIWDLETAGVGPETGLLLYDLIRTYRPRVTLETGFAYGFSTLFILQALWDNGAGTHEAIDPVEATRWHGIGLANVKRAGFDSIFNHVDMISQLALPALMSNQARMEFAFVDGSHLFDETLLDAYYIDRMLAVGGLMVFDDWGWMPAVRSAVNFIELNLGYEVVAVADARNVRVLRKISGPARAWDHFRPFEVSTSAAHHLPPAIPSSAPVLL